MKIILTQSFAVLEEKNIHKITREYFKRNRRKTPTIDNRWRKSMWRTDMDDQLLLLAGERNVLREPDTALTRNYL